MNHSSLNPENLQKLIDIGISLSKEKNIDLLLEKILTEAREISNSDGGTLYLKTNDNRLRFKIMHNQSKNIYLGGSHPEVPQDKFFPVKLYVDSQPNMHSVSAVCALKGVTIKIDDAYTDPNFDFSGPKGFDAKNMYRSKSFLNVPLKNHKSDVIGVLQLLNAQDDKNNIISFSEDLISLVESLASQASIALTNQLLIEEQKELFKSFIQLVSEALEKKDKATGGHCTRVPNITMMIADAINNDISGNYKKFKFSDDEMEELYVAGWLHDFGKVATPEYVMNKSTKLEGLYDKIDHIKVRFEVLKRDVKIKYYDLMNESKKDLLSEMHKEIKQIEDDCIFLQKCNIGGESFSDDFKDRILKISEYKIFYNGDYINILSKKEVDFLSLERGTLSSSEKKVMNDHVSLTYELLDKLPYPKHLRQVPFYAGCHHEKIDGSGYPNGYKGDQLPIQARIIALADVFEGLTAPDRPYKKGYKLSKAMRILRGMTLDNEIDKNIFNLFIEKKLYLKYAEEYINSSQIDEIKAKDFIV